MTPKNTQTADPSTEDRLETNAGRIGTAGAPNP
jgi:hypothetical protein